MLYYPPKQAQNNAQKVLDWKAKYKDEVKAMTPVGWARANQLAKGKGLSLRTVKRMASFARHKNNAIIKAEYKNTPWKDKGHVAWLGWGGDSGIEWAKKISQKNNMKEENILYIHKLSENETISDIEILRIGKIPERNLTITAEMLNDYVKNFYNNAYGTELQVNFRHDREGEAGGWIKDVYVQDDRLMAKVEWTPLGIEKIKNKQYKYTSSELKPVQKHHTTGELVKNVLIGVGLTNIPAVKGMNAVTLSENNELINLDNDMDNIKKQYEELMKKESLTSAELEAFENACGDDKNTEEVKAMCDKLASMVKNSEEPPAEPPKEEDPKAEEEPPAEEEKTEEPKEEEKPAEESVEQLSEKLKTKGMVVLSESELQELSEMAELGKEAHKKLKLSETKEMVKNSFCLSESRKTGFKTDETTVSKVANFIVSLSDEQKEVFQEILSEVKSVDLEEKGVKAEEEDKSGISEEEKLEKANKEAQELAEKENKPLHEALAEVYKKNKLI